MWADIENSIRTILDTIDFLGPVSARVVVNRNAGRTEPEDLRLYSIGSGCTLLVPFVIYALLEHSEIIGTKLHDGRVAWHAHVIDKDAKLPDAKLVHALKLRHYLVKHLRVFGISKRFARVNCPDEVDLGLAGNLCDIAHHVLVKIANALLVFSNRCRVGVTPVTGMIWIALCAIHIGVHLVSSHEAEQVLCHLGGIRHSIVALDDAAVLDIGIVVDCDAWQVGCALIEHLLKRCQSAEHSVSVFTNDCHISLTFTI